MIECALADAAKHSESERPQLEDRLGSTRNEIARLERKLERYFEAFEDGHLSPALCQVRVRDHRDRLETLREREAALARRLATDAYTSPDGAALATLADQLEEIVTSGSPEQAKELLRLLVKEIRVHNRRRILPVYRVPAAVRAIPRKVGGTGLEPVTPSLSTRSGVRVSSLMFAQSAWLSGISWASEHLTERERTSNVAIVATRIQMSGDCTLAHATQRSRGQSSKPMSTTSQSSPLWRRICLRRRPSSTKPYFR
jgi:hypothetical protein